MGGGEDRECARGYVRRHGLSLAGATLLMLPAGWLVAVSQHGPHETRRSGGFSSYTTTGDIGYLFLAVFLPVAALAVLAAVFSLLSACHRLVPRTLHLLMLRVSWALGPHGVCQVFFALLR